MSSPSRRKVLCLLAAAPVLAACGSTTKAGASMSAAPGTPATGTPVPPGADVVMVVRHAEKPKGSKAPYGITSDGERSDGSLTVQGWTRAGALVELFAPAADQPVRAGLVRPTAVYAAKPDGDASQRPSQTVTPLAARLGVQLNTSHGKGDEAALVAELTALRGATLVSWQHEEIPALAQHFGAQPAPPTQWPDDRFDVVWVFTKQSSGSWVFGQVPELLLAGDRQDVI
ncbi:hypothetical protein F0L68_02990 [Solihabitans fulvus]|uniref:Histidine phosphatase superfamily (Branch 1) n=1 Tax=Solihabitans fulvus TaxID=1892852 RepID=A0A5B2XT47_9PSEU|nr:hypothetical protein [Solihabitans fulvus]KAA2266100.1 hypothetical protein F0L68_02990 [Solihabitans fulvus]